MVSITDNLCTQQENVGLRSRAVSNQDRVIMAPIISINTKWFLIGKVEIKCLEYFMWNQLT